MMILWMKKWDNGERRVYATAIQLSKRKQKIIIQFVELDNGKEKVKDKKIYTMWDEYSKTMVREWLNKGSN